MTETSLSRLPRQSVRAPRRSAPRLTAPRALRRAAPALVCYLAVRLIGLLCVVTWALSAGRHPRTVLGQSWDSLYYLHIAQHGYRTWFVTPDGLTYSDLAFFPLYPGCVRAVTELLPLGPVDAALLVSGCAGVVAAWGIFAIGELLHGRRAGLVLVALWALLPHAVVLNMAYAEALFIALCAWALYALLTRRPVLAGMLAALAGLTRPSGLAVIAAVFVAAALDRRNPRAWAGAALAPLGWLGHVAWVGVRTGNPLGYLEVQAKWESSFDFGYFMLRYTAHLLLTREELRFYVMLLVVVAALVAFAFLVRGKLAPPPLLVYTAALLVLALGQSGNPACKARFLLPAFPLLLPVAVGLLRTGRRKVVALLAVPAVLSLLYGAYLVAQIDKPV